LTQREAAKEERKEARKQERKQRKAKTVLLHCQAFDRLLHDLRLRMVQRMTTSRISFCEKWQQQRKD